jgi:SAM-dependent methyltransferase
MSLPRTATSDYDVVSYPPGAYRQTHPDRLATIGTLLGMDTPDVGACRVLEVGCGDGSNLIPMAVALPGSTFLGVDLAEAPIQRGRALIEAAGLTNVELQALDLLQFPGDYGQFDYIIAHGLLSWVPDFVRKKWWQVVADHLSPNGVAYASYNAYPAGHLRNATRDIMNFHLARQSTPVVERAATGREFLEKLADMATGDPVWKSVLTFESQRLRTQRLEVIHHDEAGPCFMPFHFSDIAGEADHVGLRYVAEASVRRLFAPVNAAMRDVLDALGESDLVSREQYLDFLEFRSFRETVFCRKEVVLRRDGIEAALSKVLAASALCKVPGAADGRTTFRDRKSDGVIHTNNPEVIRILERLESTWPSALRIAEFAGNAGEAIGQLVAAGLVELRMHPLVPRRRMGRVPVASSLARVQLATGTRTSNLLHFMVELDLPIARQLVCRLDGTPSMRDLERICAGIPGGAEAVLEPLYRHGLLLNQP